MALKATIYKAELMVSDMDRNHYQTYNLTIAQHPSETVERMMVRIAAFALNAADNLEFTRGLSTDDEPDLWAHSLSDEVELWIELGQPDEKRIRKACNKAQKSVIYTYHGRAAQLWWEQMQNTCRRFSNLSVFNFDADAIAQLEGLVDRSMRLQANIQDGTLWLGNNDTSIELTPERLQG
ncbi:YaeQ family protein [Thalassolituus sp. LLYu03]|uniref:YaeQ family protein n=1 Tax=Thalassolituus sp. LLYu03 TaxID=3421656 RepID=UPI003D2E422D